MTNHLPQSEIFARAPTLGVEDLMNQPCRTLSYGQQQRFAILRSLCQPFDLLLLDEPFSHLDEVNIQKATQLIENECATQNTGLILASLGKPYFFDYDATLDI